MMQSPSMIPFHNNHGIKSSECIHQTHIKEIKNRCNNSIITCLWWPINDNISNPSPSLSYHWMQMYADLSVRDGLWVITPHEIASYLNHLVEGKDRLKESQVIIKSTKIEKLHCSVKFDLLQDSPFHRKWSRSKFCSQEGKNFMTVCPLARLHSFKSEST